MEMVIKKMVIMKIVIIKTSLVVVMMIAWRECGWNSAFLSQEDGNDFYDFLERFAPATLIFCLHLRR